VTQQAEVKGTVNWEEHFFVPSDYLKSFRAALKQWKEFEPILGVAAQFRVVVDTNVVLGDIMWLCGKRKNTDARTCLMEVIEAETVEAYAPPALIEEVEEKIPLIAAEKGIDKGQMLEQWKLYKLKLKIREPDTERVLILQNGVDPDDAFFIALAELVEANGVVSKDNHIEVMGGNRITVECVASLRDYSRAIAINMNIKVSGVVLSGITFAAIRGVFLGIKSLFVVIAKAPDWVKVALVAGALFVAFHPRARATVTGWLKTAMAGIKDATPVIAEQIAEAAALAGKHEADMAPPVNNACRVPLMSCTST